jgi:multiple sugar transport system substrate-binding protein
MDRRRFLGLAGSAAAAAAFGAACGSGSSGEQPTAATNRSGPGGSERTLRIAQWSHFVPAYDTWFDNEYVRRWGEEHDIEVIVNHLPLNELPIRGDSEAAAERGHDLFWFINPRAALEDDVIDHREIVEEVTAKVGRMTGHVERSILNPKTNRFFAFPDHWAAGPVHYRVDLWERIQPELRPSSWDDVRRAGSALKAAGHPLGLGISTDLDSSWTLNTLLHSYGGAIQDEGGNLTISSPATVEAVKVCAEIFRTGMTEEVFAWDGASNNRLLTSGRGSLILNAVSALRAAEQQDPGLAAKVALAPAPVGPTGNQPRCTYAVGSYVIWKFSPRVELAKQFLVDFTLAYRDAFIQSGFYNLPAFPGAVSDLNALVGNDPSARPPDKYALLADAATWSTNAGSPGYLNAAIDEVFNQFILSKMFSSAARGEMSPAEAVATAEAEMRPVFDKWRDRGKL